MNETIKEFLKSNGMRLTYPRQKIIDILLINKDRVLSADNIFLMLEKKSVPCDRATVYRNLESLKKIGLVDDVKFSNNATGFKIKVIKNFSSKNPEPEHQHYFKCKTCQKIKALKVCALTGEIQKLKRAGYKVDQHHIEISGLCPKCKK